MKKYLLLLTLISFSASAFAQGAGSVVKRVATKGGKYIEALSKGASKAPALFPKTAPSRVPYKIPAETTVPFMPPSKAVEMIKAESKRPARPSQSQPPVRTNSPADKTFSADAGTPPAVPPSSPLPPPADDAPLYISGYARDIFSMNPNDPALFERAQIATDGYLDQLLLLSPDWPEFSLIKAEFERVRQYMVSLGYGDASYFTLQSGTHGYFMAVMPNFYKPALPGAMEDSIRFVIDAGQGYALSMLRDPFFLQNALSNISRGIPMPAEEILLFRLAEEQQDKNLAVLRGFPDELIKTISKEFSINKIFLHLWKKGSFEAAYLAEFGREFQKIFDYMTGKTTELPAEEADKILSQKKVFLYEPEGKEAFRPRSPRREAPIEEGWLGEPDDLPDYAFMRPGVKKLPLTPANIKKVVEMNPKASTEKIAQFFGVSNNTIRHYIEKYPAINYKLKTKPIALTPEELAKYVEEHPDATIDDLAAAFDVSSGSIQRLIEQNPDTISYDSKLHRTVYLNFNKKKVKTFYNKKRKI